VENGRVPAGSYLLVESLDRLSRQEILKSLALFLRILSAGIVLVTLQDDHVYQGGQINLPDLIISLMIMSRAHEESATKSQRVAAAWANKRSQANALGRPLTRLCPAWLKLNDDRKRYVEIPERVAVIRSIFEDTVAGIGGYVITNRLNAKRAQSFGRSRGWQRSYIAKILSNRAVIGEYQPHKLVGGKRKPVGEPIKDYFPRIIDDELFYRAQQSRSERRISGRGRKGTYLTNLFSGLATCAYCGSRMAFENKGPPPKGGTFLVCEASKRGMGCVTTGWRYEQFESSFLAFVEQLDLPNIIRNDESEKRDLNDAIQSLQGQQLALKTEMESAYGLLKINPDLAFVADKLGQLQQTVKDLERQIEEKKDERENLEATENAFYESKDEIKSLIGSLQTPGEGDLYKLRSQVVARIKALVDSLLLAPAGRAPIVNKTIAELKKMTDDAVYKAALVDVLNLDKDRRYFAVRFKDGNVLGVYPSKDDPLVFETKVVAIAPGTDRGTLIRLQGDGSGRVLVDPKSEINATLNKAISE
jgi:DNA invertase Pin-like site-specific DNA recombinase